MQFYLDGYRPGDPLTQTPHASVAAPTDGVPEHVDVLIVGCGPAGLVLAAQLANFPEITTAVIDRRDGPLEIGQADGVACRTVEMFEAFGLAGRLIDEGYWVNEVCFWRPDPADPSRITRTGRVADVEEGLSEFPHVIVNQARMLAYLLEYMERSASRLRPAYGLRADHVEINTDSGISHPVTATLHRADGATRKVQAKYVVGCEGARSVTREAIGQKLVGDVTDQAWGVMDVLAVTDFPDIRKKCAINSADHGNILVIPREGGYLTRFYIELLDGRDVTVEELTEIANRVIHPYTVTVKDVGWWSVYAIGQRLCDRFDDVPEAESETRLPRVFIAGDACHTHSAKAGQGMNVSMADAWNLGWKLVNVLRGTARPELLHTYSAERQAVAKELIDFDREFSKLFSAEVEPADPQEFQRYFVAQGRFTAGVATAYGPSLITAQQEFQHLAKGYPIGMRFHSAPVVRLADAKPVHLGHAARADGAWRIYVFGDQGDPSDELSAVRELCEFLGSDSSPLKRCTPTGAEPDSVVDVRAVFQQAPEALALERLPSILLPRKGRFGLIDYEKTFCPDPKVGDIFDMRDISREGCMVLVRPDQHVAHVLPLDAHNALSDYFAPILTDAS